MGPCRDAHFSTVCVHAGQSPDPATGAIVTPIYQTSTFVHDALGAHKGYEYSRTANPTRDALEQNVAAMEGGARGLAFASGMAAIHAVTSLLRTGDHILASDAIYGGSYRLFETRLPEVGVTCTYVDLTDPPSLAAAVRPTTRMVFAESPTNPTLRVTDLRAIAEVAHAHGLELVVDNTFASPALQRPIALGADYVVHSTTKYLNGHSDSVGGVVVTATDAQGERLAFIQNAAGAVLGPFDAWLVLRGTKTLAVRMATHSANALAVARFLADHPKVERVYYPGLPSHPQHDLASRQMDDYGGMLAFDVGSREAATRVLNGVRLIALAESLGGVESLIAYPAEMSHKAVTREARERVGVTDGLVRLSVGIEHVADIQADVEQALDEI